MDEVVDDSDDLFDLGDEPREDAGVVLDEDDGMMETNPYIDTSNWKLHAGDDGGGEQEEHR